MNPQNSYDQFGQPAQQPGSPMAPQMAPQPGFAPDQVPAPAPADLALGMSPEEHDRQTRIEVARLALRDAHAAVAAEGGQTSAQRLAEMNGQPIPTVPVQGNPEYPTVPPVIDNPYAGTGAK
jgi:hypothetical protein